MKKFIGIAVGLFVVFTISFLIAEHYGFTDEKFVTQHITALRNKSDTPVLVGVVIGGLLAGDLFLPVPSSVVMTLSGFFMGTWKGAAVSFAGAMFSALLGFGLCRLFGRKAFNRLVGSEDTTRVAKFLETYGVWAIILSRSVPMLTEVMSCLAGLGLMSARKFAVLSAAGTLPICLVYAWAGSRPGQLSFGIGWAVAVAFVIPALGFGIVKLVERKKVKSPVDGDKA
ncbi:MAG: hypothetical protein C0404_03515 [Verrucomicrobia bacterium]|nr:hypothetical protein [Verrucomicrobiota bacterium]